MESPLDLLLGGDSGGAHSGDQGGTHVKGLSDVSKHGQVRANISFVQAVKIPIAKN